MNMPINVEGTAIGVITEIIDDTENYIEVKGILRKTMMTYYAGLDDRRPAAIEISI